MPTRKFTRVYRRPPAASEQPPLESDFASLVDLLHAIRLHGVPILPILPQKPLGFIGRGLSGDIEQSRADLATLFAFKEGIPDKLERDTELIQDWYSLVTQVTLLQHAPIRDSPRFIDLVGLSFYVPLTNAAKKRAWPLFVTSRVNRGDLTSFLLKNQLGLLTDAIRMQLFAEAAEAVYVLHECCVAHGDIKPENFLIDQFEDGDGELNCMLNDFGSSTIRGQKRLPTLNEPWNAPELDTISDGLDFEEIAQTDIFAFGLISIHILMPLKELEKFSLCLIRRPEETDDRWRQTTNDIRRAKRSKGLGSLTERLLRMIEASDISAEWRGLLRKIILASVGPSAGQRSIPWPEILPSIQDHLSHSFSINPREPVHPPPTTSSSTMLDHSSHEIFNLAVNLGELDDTDYILRANIVDDILYKASHSNCASCRKDYAFQFAVSRQFGFGCSKEQRSHMIFLEESGRTQDDLSAAIQDIGFKYEFITRVPNSVLNALAATVLVSAERVEEYQISQRLKAAKKAINEEIDARAHELGADHLCLAKIKWELSLLLKAQAILQDAERSQREVVQILAHNIGEHHTWTLIAKIVLANILADRGRQGEALDFYKTLQPSLDKGLGPRHPETVTALQLLGISFLALGQFTDAEGAFEKVVLFREKRFSPMHPLTVEAELCLATTFRLHGHLRKALAVLEHIDSNMRSFFTQDDKVKAQVYISQAVLYTALESLEQAGETISKASRAIESLQLAEDHSLRLSALQAKSLIHEARGELNQQESVLRRVLRAKTLHGDESPTLWDTKTQLAGSLLRQGQLIPAHDMANEVIMASEESATEDPDNIDCCTSIVALSLSRQGKKEKALEISYQFCHSCLKLYGSGTYNTVRATGSLVRCLVEQNQYEEARVYCEEMLPYYREEGNRGAEGIAVLRCIAFISNTLGDFTNTEAYCKEAILWATETYGEDHVETLKVYDMLVRAYVEMGKCSDAENTYRAKFGAQYAGSQLDLAFKRQLAKLRIKEGDFDAATALRHEVYRLKASSLGRLHPDTIKLTAAVISDAMDIALPDQVETESLENIQDMKQVVGASHPLTIKSIAHLAYVYGLHGRFQEAEKLFTELDSFCNVDRAPNPKLYAQILGRRADLFFRRNQLMEAEELERKALAIRTSLHGDSHHIVLTNKVNLATTLIAQKKHTDAERYLSEVVGCLEGNLSRATPQAMRDFLRHKGSLAAVMFAQGRFEDAAAMYTSIVETAEQVGLDESTVSHWKRERETVLSEQLKQEKAQI